MGRPFKQEGQLKVKFVIEITTFPRSGDVPEGVLYITAGVDASGSKRSVILHDLKWKFSELE